MINQYIQQLRSSDAGTRRQAIIALGKSNDPSALSHLADSYRGDPDPSLRELALKAGRYLKQQIGDAAPPAAAERAPRTKETSERIRRQVEEDDEDEVETSTKPEPIVLPRKVVTSRDIATSKGYIDAALTQYELGANGKAVKLLKQAIDVNPDIIKDNYFLSVAASATNRSGEDSIRFLLDKGEVSSFARESARDQVRQRKSKHLESARGTSWGGVGLEALVYILLNTVGIAIILLVLLQVMQNIIEDPALARQMEIPSNIVNQLRGLASLGVVLIVVYSLVAALFGTLSLFIYGGVVHLAAVYIFRGKGLYRNFMDRLLGFFNKRLLVYYGLGLLATVLTFAAGAPILGACVGIIVSFYAAWMTWQQLKVTSDAYDFGLLGGCLSNIAAGALLMVFFVIVQVALGASLDAALTNAIR